VSFFFFFFYLNRKKMIAREEKNENWFKRNFSFDNHQQLPLMEANDGEAHATLLANNVAASFGCNFLFL
jgi:hypothetical protein